MNNIVLNSGSVADILAGLESIGFTVDTTNNTAKWALDTNNRIYISVVVASNTQTALKIYGNSAVIHNGFNVTTASSLKLTYERIGNSIVFGLQPATSTGNIIHMAIIEPKDTGDDWLYVCPYISTGTMNVFKVINGANENFLNPNMNPLYAGSANGIQICKYYDGVRFVGNLYLLPTSASIGITTNGIQSAVANNYVEATIGSDTYLVINPTAITNGLGTKFAIKKTALTS